MPRPLAFAHMLDVRLQELFVDEPRQRNLFPNTLQPGMMVQLVHDVTVQDGEDHRYAEFSDRFSRCVDPAVLVLDEQNLQRFRCGQAPPQTGGDVKSPGDDNRVMQYDDIEPFHAK